MKNQFHFKPKMFKALVTLPGIKREL